MVSHLLKEVVMAWGPGQRRVTKARRRKAAAVKERRKAGLAAGDVRAGRQAGVKVPAYKLSDALLALAEPLWTDDKADEDLSEQKTFNLRHNSLVLAKIGWNLALLPSDRRQEEMVNMFEKIPQIDDLKQQEKRTGLPVMLALEETVSNLMARKEWMFPADRRWVVDCKFTERSDEYNLLVTSKVLPE